MNLRAAIAGLTLALIAWGTVHAAQFQQRRWAEYEPEMQNPADDPPDAYEKTEFAFARLRYRNFSRGFFRGGSWGTDANKAERQLVQGVRRLTRLHARSIEEIIDVDDDEMFNWPWLYAVEVGHWDLSESQAQRLRDYLNRGGFLMVDDFHGSYEWNVFLAGLRRVFPDRPVVDIPDNDPIFHVMYDLNDRFQVPGLQFAYTGRTYERDGFEAQWRGVYDDTGRIMVAICHNVDLGDAWEWADHPRFPEKFASQAYRIAINYIIYALTR